MSKHDIRIDRRKLHPWLNYKLTLLLKKCAKKGIYLIITEGFRSKEYQDELYAKGRTAPGKIVTGAKGSFYASQHQWGIAFDVALRYDVDGDGSVKDDVYNLKGIKDVAKIAKKIGLSWGGDWKGFQDTPHFYLKKWGDTTSKLKSLYGTPDTFKKTWVKKVKGTKKGLNIWNKSKTKVLKKKVPNGTKINVMYSKLWYAKVEYNGVVGYMKKKYLV